MTNLIIVSGGFDPIHSGHISMMNEAAKLGDVIALVNSDEFLIKKKGKCFMNILERANIVDNLKAITFVVFCAPLRETTDEDGTVINGIRYINGEYSKNYFKVIFANGGDRVKGNVPEEEFCKYLGIELIYNVGGGKTQSSSNLLKDWEDAK